MYFSNALLHSNLPYIFLLRQNDTVTHTFIHMMAWEVQYLKLDTPPALPSYGGTRHRCSGKGPTKAPQDNLSADILYRISVCVGRRVLRKRVKSAETEAKIPNTFHPNCALPSASPLRFRHGLKSKIVSTSFV